MSAIEHSDVVEPLPPLTPQRQFARAALVTAAVGCLVLAVHLGVISGLQQRAAQSRAFNDFREQLAIGTAPIGPTDERGALLDLGTPVAHLRIPAIGVEQVVGEGTTSDVLFDGPGHRRDTPLPGQEGTSIVMGRRALFGGPFGGLGSLTPGDQMIVTTGQGEFTFEVFGIRRDGDPSPARAPAGTARLTLITAAGAPFLPEGALRVDAALVGTAVGGAQRPFTAATLPSAERLMETDPGTVWALAMWLQSLIVVLVAAVWSWHRWGRAQTWIVFATPVLLIVAATSGEAARLLPNVM